MNYHPLDFTIFESSSEEISRLRKIFEEINPRYSRWLRSAAVCEDLIKLSYNGNSPTPNSLRKEIEPLLREANLPETVEIKIRRPAELHIAGKEFLMKLKTYQNGDSIISDFKWIKEEEYPALYYLSQYQFVKIENEQEILGFDEQTNKMWFKQWISSIEITENEGESLLCRWCEDESANKAEHSTE